MQLVLIICGILLNLLLIFLYARISRFAKNQADILQNREKVYEQEKGKNLATKEDIAEITRSIESAKSYVSLYNRKQYELLSEQERVLIDLLFDATKIDQFQNSLFLYQYNTTTRLKFDSLVESVNETLTHFYHQCNLAVIYVSDDDVEKMVGMLSMAVTKIASQIGVKAMNVANLIDQQNNQVGFAIEKAKTDQDKTTFLAAGIRTKQQIEQLCKEPLLDKDQLGDTITVFCDWLKRFFGKNFFIPGFPASHDG